MYASLCSGVRVGLPDANAGHCSYAQLWVCQHDLQPKRRQPPPTLRHTQEGPSRAAWELLRRAVLQVQVSMTLCHAHTQTHTRTHAQAIRTRPPTNCAAANPHQRCW